MTNYLGSVVTTAKWNWQLHLFKHLPESELSQPYIAQHINSSIHTNYFVKFLTHSTSHLPIAQQRLQNEFEIHRAVSLHQHIVSVVNWGISADGIKFLVLPYLQGGTLETALRDRHWHERTKLQAFVNLCSAIDFLHRHGYVHNDIKRRNIMLGRPNNLTSLQLIDFSLAKCSATTPAYFGQEGTWGERAPEQADEGAEAGEAADVFQLGLILAALLYGNEYAKKIGRRVEDSRKQLLPRQIKRHRLHALLRDMLQTQPATRPTTRMILARLTR